MNKLQKIFLAILLFSTFFVRFYKVETIPAGLYHDEVDAGYQARSFLETGKDYRGSFSPFYFNSFVDPRTPVPVWITAISTFIFSTPELEVRMGSVFTGTVNVLLIFLLIKLWTKNYLKAMLTATVFAANPWQIQFSRFNHEAHSTLFFILASLLFFTFAISRKKIGYLFLSAIFLGFSMYTYRTMSLLSPLMAIVLFIIFRMQLVRFGFRKLILAGGLYLIITVPFLYATTLAAVDTPRIAQISIFSDPKIPVQIQRDRELDSGDLEDFQVGKKPAPESFVFHNKVVSGLTEFINNYFSTFSVDFLFLNGDKNKRHSVEGQGMLLLTDFAALGVGLYFLFKNFRDSFNRFILAFFFLAPAASALTQDGAAHGARLFAFSLPLLTAVGFGYFHMLGIVKKYRYKMLLLAGIVCIWGGLFLFYLHNYFVHSYYSSARWHSYGFKESFLRLLSENRTYSRVNLTGAKDPPIIFYLYWMNIPPGDVQQYGSNFSADTVKNLPLDRLKASELPYNDLPSLIKSLKEDEVYLLSQKEIPPDLRNQTPPSGINLIDVITYPDKEVAFYLISKQNGKQIPIQN